MRSIGWIIFTCAILMAGCTCSQRNQSSANATTKKTLNLFIWGEYTSPAVLAAFEQKTGIHIIETNFGSNEEMLAKLQAGATGYDVIVPSDYMIKIMIKLGLLTPLDRSKIPNIEAVEPQFLGKEFDPQNEYSLPYSWSSAGIAVVKSKTPVSVTSYRTLLTHPQLKGRVSLLDDMREVFAVALRLQGDSINTVDPTKLQQAADTLSTAKHHIKEFNSTPAQALAQGDVVAAHMYSNEALRAAQKNPDIAFVLPSEGATMAIDSMILLKSSTHQEEAFAFMNFMLDPETNRQFVEDMIVAPVSKGVVAKLSESLRNNDLISKGAESLKNTEAFQDIGDATTLYDRLWTEIKAK